MVSRFKMVGVGIVAKDIEEYDNYLYVFPVEHLNTVKVDIKDSVDVEKVTVTKEDGELEDIVVDTEHTIRAKWLPLGEPNRLEPPMMCAGEMVDLYGFGDGSRFYWVPKYNEVHRRKRDKHSVYVSNKDEPEDPEELVMDSYYYNIIDAVNKFVKIHTSTNDGEAFGYDIEINTKNSTLVIGDRSGNEVIIESVDGKLTINTNKDVIINTENITENIRNNKKANVVGRDDSVVGNWTVSNGRDEIIALIGEFLQAVIDIEHVGNLGIPTGITGGSESVLADIKARVLAFK